MWTIVTELHISMILFLISRQHIGSVRYPQQHVFREHMGRIGAILDMTERSYRNSTYGAGQTITTD